MFLFFCRSCKLTTPSLPLPDDFQTFHASHATLHHIANLSIAIIRVVKDIMQQSEGQERNPRQLLFFGNARGLNRNTENKSIVFVEAIGQR